MLTTFVIFVIKLKINGQYLVKEKQLSARKWFFHSLINAHFTLLLLKHCLLVEFSLHCTNLIWRFADKQVMACSVAVFWQSGWFGLKCAARARFTVVTNSRKQS